MEFQRKAMEATRTELPGDKSLIGFVGGPWTLFAYAVEGSHKGGLKKAKSFWPLFPKFSTWMLKFLEQNIALQLAGGAEVVMILDTAGGELSPLMFQQGVVPGIRHLANQFPNQIGYYSQQTQLAHIEALCSEAVPLAGLGFDHRWSLNEALKLRRTGMVQGNFDQTLLFSGPDDFEYRLKEFLQPLQEMSVEERAGWVCGLGHGILPETPEVNVRRFINRVREVFS
jgi:uroporphyrinogen decarboxylase